MVIGECALLVTGNIPSPHSAVDAREGTMARPITVRPRNIVLVSIDSLRADHVGCYGYDRPTTPNIDRLAIEGVRFSTAYASSSWTLPSHASMLTGRYPLSHGAISLDHPLTEATPTLTSVLGKAGYTTGGFVSYEFLRRHYGFAVDLCECQQRQRGHLDPAGQDQFPGRHRAGLRRKPA